MSISSSSQASTMEELESSISKARNELKSARTTSSKKRLELYDLKVAIDQKHSQLLERMKTGINDKQCKKLYQSEFISGKSVQYVSTVQGNLCQKLHWFGIYQNQIRMITDMSKQEVQITDDTIESLAQSDPQLSLLKQVHQQDESNFELRMRYLDVIKAQTNIIRKLDLCLQPKFPSNPHNYMHKLVGFLDEDDDDEEEQSSGGSSDESKVVEQVDGIAHVKPDMDEKHDITVPPVKMNDDASAGNEEAERKSDKYCSTSPTSTLRLLYVAPQKIQQNQDKLRPPVCYNNINGAVESQVVWDGGAIGGRWSTWFSWKK